MVSLPAGAVHWLSSCNQEPWEEVIWLLIIRDDEKGINQFFTEMVQRWKPDPPVAMKEGQAESVFIRLGNDGEGWKLTTSGIRRRIPAPVAHLQLQNTLVPFFQMAGGSVQQNTQVCWAWAMQEHQEETVLSVGNSFGRWWPHLTTRPAV